MKERHKALGIQGNFIGPASEAVSEGLLVILSHLCVLYSAVQPR